MTLLLHTMGNIYMNEHPYEKIKNNEQFCVFWYITMTVKFHLFRH